MLISIGIARNINHFYRKDFPLRLELNQPKNINVPCDFYTQPKDLRANIHRKVFMKRYNTSPRVRRWQSSHCWNNISSLFFRCPAMQSFNLPLGRLNERRKVNSFFTCMVATHDEVAWVQTKRCWVILCNVLYSFMSSQGSELDVSIPKLILTKMVAQHCHAEMWVWIQWAS